LVTVMVCVGADVPTAVLGKVSEVGDRLTAGVGVVALPDRPTVCGEPVALSAMLTEAVSVPAAAGVKVTVMVQLTPTATLAPQVLV